MSRVASATSGLPRSARPPERSIRQAAPTTSPRMAFERREALARRQAGGDDVLDHDDPGARRNGKAAAQLERCRPRARRRSPWRRERGRSRSPARCRRRPARRPRRPCRNAAVIFSASALHSRSVRTGSMKTNIFCRKTGECRPDDRMKWPSSSAPAARNSANTSSWCHVGLPVSQFPAAIRLRRAARKGEGEN